MALPSEEQAGPGQSAEEAGYEQISDLGSDSNGHGASAFSHITLNGMEFTIYGNVQGLELLQLQQQPHPDEEASDCEDDESTNDADEALRKAMEADVARRSTPLTPQQRGAVMEAMKNVSIDFRPDWAEKISEEQWMSNLQLNNKP